MLTFIRTLDKLEKYFPVIHSLYNHSGLIFSQHFASLKASLSILGGDRFVIVLNEEESWLMAFEKVNEFMYQSAIPGFPVLGLKKNNSASLYRNFQLIKKELCCNTLYFPLVYEGEIFSDIATDIPHISVWPRLPSPIICKAFSSEVMTKRVIERYGTRALRQKSKFERNLEVKQVYSDQIPKVIKEVELSSWKRQLNQDMFSRGYQFEYYTQLIQSDVAVLFAAYDGEKPIAYRIDAVVNDILYAIKWSFNEEYKKYSPGFYLLAFDLFRQYEGKKIKYIDLFGSPDTLKDILETKRINRCDFCFSQDLQRIQLIKSERTRFDEKLTQNYVKRESIKNAFGTRYDQTKK